MSPVESNQHPVFHTAESIRLLFEESSEFIKVHRRRRAGGGENSSYQLVLKDLKVKLPIIIGSSIANSESVIREIRPVSEIANYAEYPHLVFDGGEYHSLQFDRYHLTADSDEYAGTFSSNIKLEINGGEFFGPVRFSNSRFQSIVITGGVFHSEVCFERGVYGHVEVSGGKFKRGLYFGNIKDFDSYTPFIPPPGNAPAWTSKDDGIFSSVKLSGGTSISEIILQNCCIEGNLELLSKDSEFRITGVTIKDTLEIKQGSYLVAGCNCNKLVIGAIRTSGKLILDIEGSKFNIIQFQRYNGKDSAINLKSVISNKCIFRNFLNYGTIAFNQVSLIKEYTDYTQYRPIKASQALNRKAYYGAMFYGSQFGGQEALAQRLEFYEPALRVFPDPPGLSETSIFELLNSDLGKTSFVDSNLGNGEMLFRNSKLTDIFLAGATLPEYFNRPEADNSYQHLMALSQIRKVYENRGDNVAAAEYQAQELEILRRNSKWWGNFKERFPLALHYQSSFHGQNWRRAFLWLVGSGFVLWMVICLFIFDMPVLNVESLKIGLSSLSYFLQFLLPVHRIDLVDEFAKNVGGSPTTLRANGWVIPVTSAIDGIWRIVSGYLVFQLIAAFRKHGKK